MDTFVEELAHLIQLYMTEHGMSFSDAYDQAFKDIMGDI